MNKYRLFSQSALQFLYSWSLSSCFRNFSTLRINLYSGGPNNIPTKIITKNISFHPIAMTGSQAIILVRIATNPSKNFLFMDYFSIGILIPWRFAASMAISYPASACRTTPIPGSVVRTLSNLRAASGVPSATMTCPACWL